MAELLLGPLLRYVGDDMRRLLGRDRRAVRGARCSAPTRARPSRRRATTTRWCAPRASSRAPRYEYEVRARRRARLAAGGLGVPAEPVHPAPTRRTTAHDRLRLLPRGGAQRAALHPDQGRGRPRPRASTRCARSRCGCATSDPTSGPTCCCCWATRCTPTRCSPETKEFIRARRDTDEEPGAIALDFEEYTQPLPRVVGRAGDPLAAVHGLDGHDLRRPRRARRLEHVRRVAARRCAPPTGGTSTSSAALMSLLDLPARGQPEPRRAGRRTGCSARVQEAERRRPDPARVRPAAPTASAAAAAGAITATSGARALVMIDSRAGRVLEEGKRSMLDEDEWEWIEEHATGGFDHLLLATSLPWLLSPAMHHLEAWNEAVCGGAWGAAAAKAGEKAAPGRSTSSTGPRSTSRSSGWPSSSAPVGAGERGEPPASIVTLSGDVHHAYLSEVAFRRGSGVRSAVYQAVCSPMRNPLDAKRAARDQGDVTTRPVLAVTRALARAAGVPDPSVRWRMVDDGPVVRQPGGHAARSTAAGSTCRSRRRWRRTAPSPSWTACMDAPAGLSERAPEGVAGGHLYWPPRMDYPVESLQRRRARRAGAPLHQPRLARVRAREPAGDGEGGAVRPLLALPGHAAAPLPGRVRGRRRGRRGARVRRRGGRARARALRADLPRLRRRLVAQLGGAHIACEWVSNVMTKVLQRGRLASYLEQSTRYIAYDAPMAADRRLPLLARPVARARVRRARWTRCSTPTRDSPAARAGVGRRALPARRRRAGGGPRALDPGQGAGPAARPAARGLALAHGHLRLGPGLRAAAAAAVRLAAARGARLRPA